MFRETPLTKPICLSYILNSYQLQTDSQHFVPIQGVGPYCSSPGTTYNCIFCRREKEKIRTKDASEVQVEYMSVMTVGK